MSEVTQGVDLTGKLQNLAFADINYIILSSFVMQNLSRTFRIPKMGIPPAPPLRADTAAHSAKQGRSRTDPVQRKGGRSHQPVLAGKNARLKSYFIKNADALIVDTST